MFFLTTSAIAIMYCFTLYFALTFFIHLKADEQREAKQARLGAVLSLAIAMILPAVFAYLQMLNY